jgi:hypothetical protein
MRAVYLFLVFLALISGRNAFCQPQSKDTPVLLEQLFRRLANNYDDNDRSRINDSIRLIIDSYAVSDSVFNHRFNNLRYLGQITSTDSTIKIITWNLVLANGKGCYFSYFIKRENRESAIRVFKLSALYNENPITKDTVYTEKNWYGALYYDLRPCISKGKLSWILLGIDFGNPFITRKVIDVLNFSDNGSLLFGRKWFKSGDDIAYREVLEYRSEGLMSLRFSSDTSVVFDHLVPIIPSKKDDRQFYGSEFSYDAYIFDNDQWILKINVDVRNRE